MFKKTKMDLVDLLLIATVLLFLIEFLFINPALIFFILIWSGLAYFGKKSYYRPRGKIMFWIGIVFLFITVFNTLAVRFLILSFVVYFLFKWYKSKQNPDYHTPQLFDLEEDVTEKQGILFRNKWFGKQQTEKHAYEWKDINIQSGIGDMIVDLNYTMIPKSEPIIVIRNVFGNVRIIVPYDVEVSVNHSVIFGSIKVLDHVETNVWNRVLHLQTANYEASTQKVKVYTSMIVGKLEVVRR